MQNPARHPTGPAPAGCPIGVSPKFWRLVVQEPRHSVLDVGTGSGRLALALAPHSHHVLGIDRDPVLIEQARRRAAQGEIENVGFVVADAERVGYDARSLPIAATMVTAHLYLSVALIEKAAAALPGGGVLAFVGFHADQWRETGLRSRFAWDEDRVAEELERSGFGVEHLEVDTEVTTFGSLEEALTSIVGLEERWRRDGRWCGYSEYLKKGGRSLTSSHLIVKARRQR